MKKINLIFIFLIILFNNFVFTNLHAQISNAIIVKVGESLITTIDIQNEIITNLVINKQEITQENINNNKNYAIKNLINKSIKRSEINKYTVKDYNEEDLQNYILNIAKQFDTDANGLKEMFKEYKINYKTFIRKHETELLWNTLIFSLYKNQTNVNIIEVDNEVEKIKKNQSDEDLKKIKLNILNKKKRRKVRLIF